MYQIPVPSVEKIRKTRRKVKTVLSEFGLEECKNLLTELHKDPEVNSDEDGAFEETEWNDFTDSYSTVKMKKKWPYRTKPLCCSLCSYSTKNPYCFQSHISRIHQYEKNECNQGVCSQCPFVGSAKKIKRHTLLFHNAPMLAAPTPTDPPRPKVPLAHRPNERYQCRKCGFPTASIFPLKKHIVLKHLPNLAQQFIGYKIDNETKLRIYCCRLCKLQTGSLDHVIHHLLVEPVHTLVSNQVQALIQEKKYYVSATPNGVQSVPAFSGYSTFSFIAPKPQQPHVLSNGSLVLQPNQQPPGTLMTLQQLQGAQTNLICPPGPNQTLLPPQASALVQLASAEAKGLLQSGAAIALQGALAQGRPMVQFPTTTPGTSLKQAMPAAAPVPRPLMHTPPSQPVVLPSGLQVNIARRAASPSQKASTNLQTPQGTMMTSQSLLNHLIPTGNKMNGLPVYTFAPVSGASSQSKGTPLAPITSGSNSPVQVAKKWITCPLCNELFPSNVYDIHTEVAHKTKPVTSKCESLAARALFLKKMPDKTVKCLVCKILLSEKGVFEHLLHGLNCVYCSALFFSIKQLVEHVKEHNPTNKANCDFLRQEFRVYTNSTGKIVFPYFDINTSAPMQVIGDTEFHLALITTSFDLIFLKMLPSTHPEVCHSALKSSSLYCPFCDEKFANALEHLQHLKQKHLVAPTIHAILKTEALKCIYCNGVYTGKVTQQAVMLHMQRCRCSPKKQAEPPKAQEPVEGTRDGYKGRGRPIGATKPKPVEQISQPQPQPQPQPQQQPQHSLYFIQMPQTSPLMPAPSPALILQQAPPVPIPKPPVGPVETEAERESKRRLETMLKEVIEANRREREERTTMMRKRRDQEKQEKQVSPITPETPGDALVKLAVEPTSTDAWNADTLKEFMGRYFHVVPYASRAETEELSRRLDMTKSEVATHFSIRRRGCMKFLKRNKALVFMGFNMVELSKVKHNLFIPEVQVAEPAEQTDKAKEPEPMEWSTDPESTADSEPTEESGGMANTVIDANVDASDKAEDASDKAEESGEA